MSGAQVGVWLRAMRIQCWIAVPISIHIHRPVVHRSTIIVHRHVCPHIPYYSPHAPSALHSPHAHTHSPGN